MTNLIDNLEHGFENITAQTCVKMISKVRKTEDKFWQEDLKLDAEKE